MKKIIGLIMIAGISYGAQIVTPPGIQVNGLATNNNVMVYSNGMLLDSGVAPTNLVSVTNLTADIEALSATNAAQDALIAGAVQTTSTNNIVLEHGDGGYATLTLGITSELESGLGNVVISAPNGTARVYGQTGVEIDAQGGTAALYGSLNVTNDITVGGDANFTGGPLTIPDGFLAVHALNMQTADSFYLYTTGTTNKTLIDAAITAATNGLSGGGSSIQTLDLYLPAKIYATTGTECNIYFDNIITGDYVDYAWDVTLANASTEKRAFHFNERMSLNPTNINAAVNPVYLYAYDKNSGSQIGGATGTIYTAVFDSASQSDGLQTNAVNTTSGTASDAVSYAAGGINQWGNTYTNTGQFNLLEIPLILTGTNANYVTVEVRPLEPATGNIDVAAINAASVYAIGTNSVTAGATNLNVYVPLDVTVDFTNEIYFIGTRGFTDSGCTTRAAIAAHKVTTCDNLRTPIDTYYGYGAFAWLDSAGDKKIGYNQYMVEEGAVSTNVLLCIGDSTTEGGQWVGELYNLATNASMNIELIGTKTGTSVSVPVEAVSGKTWAWFYSDASSEFVNGGSFDFNYYMTNNSFSTPTHVLAHLGINDVIGKTSDSAVDAQVAADITRIDEMITQTQAYDADTKFCLMLTIPPSYNQDAFGRTLQYYTGTPQWRTKRNQVLYAKGIYDEYAGREGEGIEIIPVNLALDTKNNMSTVTEDTNARNTDQITRQSNGVHPATSGYYQMADAVWAWLSNQ